MSDPAVVLDDLRSESDELDRLVGELDDERWARATPAPGWTIAHQIAHLAWTDTAALLAVTDPRSFVADLEEAAATGADAAGFVDEGAAAIVASLSHAELLSRWRERREELHQALRAQPSGVKLPWYGPPMSATSMATARLMETWAHGQDIADALGAVREPTARLRHVAYIGIRARDFAFRVRGLTPPAEPFRVELTGPGGELWTYGPEDAAGVPPAEGRGRVTGPALDFCLLVTQRAHRADLAVRAEGADADRWLDIAQAFAGPAGPGRAPKGARP
ncbi:TIGR03084 family metal-binding protein [Streptomyces sp. NPDC000880]